MRVWCDPAALTAELRAHAADRGVVLVSPEAEAGGAASGPEAGRPRVQDLNLRVSDLEAADYRGSPAYESLLAALGFEHRREARLVDSAHRDGCAVFITRDPDILRRRERLTSLTGMRFFHPERDRDDLAALLDRPPPGAD